ncbi:MAG TPA: hypothetical protein VK841_07005 [Polyangiaceae bacterium]|jgi:hypothetical protein|nr:hypothetical protein [Polyangiaceae bacterium]
MNILEAILSIFGPRRDDRDERQAKDELAAARALLEDGNPIRAILAAASAAAAARAARTRNAALTTLAWAALDAGYVRRAEAALEAIDPPYYLDLECYAAVQAAANHPDRARQARELARVSVPMAHRAERSTSSWPPPEGAVPDEPAPAAPRPGQ